MALSTILSLLLSKAKAIYRDRDAEASLSRPASAAGVPSRKSNVKPGNRVVVIDTELIERLGPNDSCVFRIRPPLPLVLPDGRPLRRRSWELLHQRRSPLGAYARYEVQPEQPMASECRFRLNLLTCRVRRACGALLVHADATVAQVRG